MRTYPEIVVLISYCQLVLFEASYDNPFNDWQEQHTAQGFSWRPECTAFGTIEEFGDHAIYVHKTITEEAPLPTAARVIDVPFDLPSPGRLVLASVSDEACVDLGPGRYQLRFQIFDQIGEEKPVIHLTFRPCAAPIFAIVRADAGLNPGDQLLLTASPAA